MQQRTHRDELSAAIAAERRHNDRELAEMAGSLADGLAKASAEQLSLKSETSDRLKALERAFEAADTAAVAALQDELTDAVTRLHGRCSELDLKLAAEVRFGRRTWLDKCQLDLRCVGMYRLPDRKLPGLTATSKPWPR
eukprot:SAG31_NODE_2086_length_6484_cov_23.518716_6_plen_139_part_00